MKFFLGLLFGLGLGVLIGLLIAPQSGEATRAQLGEQGGVLLGSGALSDNIRARANEALSQGREVYSRTKDELGGRISKARAGEL